MVSAIRSHRTRSGWVIGVSVVVAAAAFIMAAPATAGPSASSPGVLAVTAAALPSDVLPGETTLMAVTVTNTGGSPLTGVTLSESLPAALTYLPGSSVAVLNSAAGAGSLYSDGSWGGSGVAGLLGAYTPGLLVSAYDGVELAPGDSLRVTFIVTINAALSPAIDSLTTTSIATSGTSAAASATETLTVLKQALDWAYDESAN